ncbi:hypothetical protein GWI33_004866 [Rhynchophorus ferrugineus]|uniref:RRM domain-containing protein n=2 Tax=Rhynchophorus ferrugineus TaxID=354439 RepID=A0A834IHV3_RHYFE|nr:hypothetical protein GWI33_004866 [Rhynchophorus ferrugineus]
MDCKKTEECPLAGQPRGYAFVTYVKRDDAFRAKENLNGKTVGQKKITVTWAHNADLVNVSSTKSKCDIVIPALAISKDPGKTDRTSQIQAIEAKLRLMEQKKDELKINDSIATKSSVIQQFQFNKDKLCNVQKHFSSRGSDRCKKPYIKKKPIPNELNQNAILLFLHWQYQGIRED